MAAVTLQTVILYGVYWLTIRLVVNVRHALVVAVSTPQDHVAILYLVLQNGTQLEKPAIIILLHHIIIHVQQVHVLLILGALILPIHQVIHALNVKILCHAQAIFPKTANPAQDCVLVE
jgi:hypothetical protein